MQIQQSGELNVIEICSIRETLMTKIEICNKIYEFSLQMLVKSAVLFEARRKSSNEGFLLTLCKISQFS